jgi:ubiquitin carboxyl-terminal hydrolase L5
MTRIESNVQATFGLQIRYATKSHRQPTYTDLPTKTTPNACATVALFNILMNSGTIGLDEYLRGFKAKSYHLSPALRGHALDVDDRIRNAHNSFARQGPYRCVVELSSYLDRRMDMLSTDLYLSEQAAAEKPQRNRFDHARKQKKTLQKRTPPKLKKADNNAAFHYNAYVPFEGRVWELDGLQQQPLCVGAYMLTS